MDPSTSPGRTVALALALAAMAALAGVARASECTDDGWQPTYVHDLIAPDGPYYVMPNGAFVQLTGDWTNQSGPGMCCLYGVRDARGFTTCFEYTRVQCGCGASSWGNSTCAAFLTMKGYRRPGQGGGQSQSQQWNECEVADGPEVCGSWVWDPAQGAFAAQWSNGATALIWVVSNSGGQIVLDRRDTAPGGIGFTARYVGTWSSPTTVSGSVTWSWQGNSWNGAWRAAVNAPSTPAVVPPAPPGQGGDPCDQDCQRYCAGAGFRNGRLGEPSLCLLGVVSEPARACSCW